MLFIFKPRPLTIEAAGLRLARWKQVTNVRRGSLAHQWYSACAMAGATGARNGTEIAPKPCLGLLGDLLAPRP